MSYKFIEGIGIVAIDSNKSVEEKDATIKYYEELAEELKQESKPPPKDLTNIHEISIMLFFSALVLSIVFMITKLKKIKKKGT
jgi:hypothetical protein